MSELLHRFECGDIDPRTFDHRAHIEAAVALLQAAPFMEAVDRYVRGIKALAAAAGAPHKFNMTVTIAFLSIIAERLEAAPSLDPASFVSSNPDLLAPDFLMRWYEPSRLHSPMARRQFVMPRLTA